MEMPLLQTKWYMPQMRATDLVARPRLVDQLTEGLHRKLTLVSAPAGFGKTTLVSHWLERLEYPVAWLSLDEGDNDPKRFFSYLVAALQTVDDNLGLAISDLLQYPQPTPITSLMALVINDLSSRSDKTPIILVLDDYHLLEAEPIHQAVNFLLDYQPLQFHLILTCRSDPPLSLSRLRVRRQITELRVADLRFTISESTAFLNQVMDLDLAANEIAALEERAEG